MRFTLVRGHWYGLTMFPGYGGVPYHSPIRVDSIDPIGARTFDLEFLNLGYASGVQHFKKRLRTLRRGDSHLVAEETEVDDRTYVIVYFDAKWLVRHFPELQPEKLFNAARQPDEQALLHLLA